MRKRSASRNGRLDRIAFCVVGRAIPKGSKIAMRRGARVWVRDQGGQRLKAWEERVAMAADDAKELAGGGAPWRGAVSVFLLVGRRAPKRAGRKPWPPGDIDKLSRAVLDAMTDVIYGDDRQVVFLAASKRWAAADDLRVIVQKGRHDGIAV